MQNRENILIYTDQEVNRGMNYVMQFVFNERLNLDYRLTSDAQFFREYIGVKLSYSEHPLDQCIHIPRHPFISQQRKVQYLQSSEEFLVSELTSTKLLFGIGEASAERHTDKEMRSDYETTNSIKFEFDVFSAILFFLTGMDKVLKFKTRRLIHQTFELGRTPVVDDWVLELAKSINNRYKMALYEVQGDTRPHLRVDVPKMYSYLYMGLVRGTLEAIAEVNNLHFKSLLNRFLVNLHLKRDPMKAYYDYMLPSLNHHAKVVLFFPLSEYNNRDRNTSYYSSVYKEFIKSMADKYEVGLLISELAMNEAKELTKEITRFEELTHKTLKWVSLSTVNKKNMAVLDSFDRTRHLNVVGLDSTRQGFSFGTTYPFNYFNHDKKTQHSLRIYPSTFFVRNQNIHYDKATVDLLQSVLMKNRFLSIHLDLSHLTEESSKTISNLIENKTFVKDALKLKQSHQNQIK